MKKIMMTGLAAMAAFVVQADIYSNFGSSFGVASSDEVSPLLGDGQQALVQLIYAGGNGIIDGIAGIGGSVTGDDVVLFEGLTPVATAGDFSFEYGLFGFVVGPIAGYTGGSVYGRIFQDSSAALGSWYYEGHVQILGDFVQSGPLGPPAESYDLGLGDAVSVNQQVIPEPATIGLMGIAGLGMFLARKKARR